MKTGAAGFDGTGNVVEFHEAQYRVSEGPGRHLLIGNRLQAVLADNGIPDGFLVGHIHG